MLGETINCAIMNIGVCHLPIISWYIPGLYFYMLLLKGNKSTIRCPSIMWGQSTAYLTKSKVETKVETSV